MSGVEDDFSLGTITVTAEVEVLTAFPPPAGSMISMVTLRLPCDPRGGSHVEVTSRLDLGKECFYDQPEVLSNQPYAAAVMRVAAVAVAAAIAKRNACPACGK